MVQQPSSPPKAMWSSHPAFHSSGVRGVTILEFEGNIGSGKSALLDGMQAAHPGMVIARKPVRQGSPTLAEFYRDRAGWTAQKQLLETTTSVERACARWERPNSSMP
eukprot:TRINITY_DN24395_c1_g4_i1.p6 TRINITY_DN24395_c1_g4~~TRINITY_DN24395_c1_g4_i1.p6  ORF type:complete len:107 (+),score=14.22 TRINITY_DN24395_c1_g4_i1:41-361(+)